MGLFLIPLAAFSSATQTPPRATAQGDDTVNVRLVGYSHMQGRHALQVTTKSDTANGNWVYVGNVGSGPCSSTPARRSSGTR